ncbi:MAG: hypothetical protein NTV49_07325 [Kiritimatiellaeota bacterium]|nr:hypothetical protein [Kiritimatiellota bacterium]
MLEFPVAHLQRLTGHRLVLGRFSIVHIDQIQIGQILKPGFLTSGRKTESQHTSHYPHSHSTLLFLKRFHKLPGFLKKVGQQIQLRVDGLARGKQLGGGLAVAQEHPLHPSEEFPAAAFKRQTATLPYFSALTVFSTPFTRTLISRGVGERML